MAAGSASGLSKAAVLAAALAFPPAARAQAPAPPSPTPTPAARAGGDFVPPTPTQPFSDYASFVPAAAAERLNAKLARFAARTGRDFRAVVFPEMPVLDPPAASLQDFTLRSANIWAAGSKGFDEGVVLFVFVRERKLRVEVGPKLVAVLTPEAAQRIVDEKITPRLARGDTADGLEAGIDAVIALLDVPPSPRPAP